MAHEHRVALEKIVALCEKSRLPTKRTERIFDIALEALGLTANQRQYKIKTIREEALQQRRDKKQALIDKQAPWAQAMVDSLTPE